MTATVHKLRAGPLPSVDTRASCRESYAHLKMVEAADEQARIDLWSRRPLHTMCPPEREYAERYSKDRSLFWLIFGPLSIAAVVGFVYIVTR